MKNLLIYVFDIMNLSLKIEKALIKASTSYPKDRIFAFKKAIENETNENAIWALKVMLENMKIAKEKKFPLCDDTGIPHVFIEIGKNRSISHEIFKEINEGIASGLKNLPGRSMAVKGNVIERLEQSKGLYAESERVISSSFLVDVLNGENYKDKIKIHLLLLGGGPEIRSQSYRIFHRRNYKEVLNASILRIKDVLKLLGCTPSIPAIGIGRTHFEANSLMIKSMIYGNLNIQSKSENYITQELNKTNIGPMGFGGKTTVLGAFMNIGPQRASGVRILATRPCCFVEPRLSTIEIA